MTLSLAKRGAFSALFSLLVLAGVECGFRVSGYHGEVDRTVSWCREHALNRPPFFARAEVGGIEAYVPMIEGQPRPFPVKKAPNTKRVFAFGGSAVHGYGFTRVGSWPDKLEERLALAWPGERVEVINAGAIAWSSQQLLSLVKDVLEHYEPDALVVVSGNNELLEWFDARKYLPPRELSGWVSAIQRARRFRKSRIYQWLNSKIGEDAGRWGQTEFSDDEALPWEERARMSDSDRDYALDAFRWNIGRILEEAREVDVPVILGTVPVNWMQSPASFEFSDAPDEGHQEELREVLQLIRDGSIEEAERILGRLMKEMPEALFAYEAGRLAREMGQTEHARRWLGEAIRLDENPHRALPAINEAIRDLATDAHGFIDIEELLEAESMDGILDGTQIYDYCHLRPDAHTLVADALAEIFVRDVWQKGVVSPGVAVTSTHIDGWLGEGVNGNRDGFSPNPGRDRLAWWKDAQAATSTEPESAQRWLDLARVVWHTFHGICGESRAPCLPEALVALEVAHEMDPMNCDVQSARGRVAYALGDDRAEHWLSQAVACNSEDRRSAWYLERWTAENEGTVSHP